MAVVILTNKSQAMDTDKSSMSNSSDQEMETGEFEGNDDRMDVDGEGDEGERWGRMKKKGEAVKRKIATESSSSESSPEQ